MYTREINGKLCEFNFGLGFVREIDKSRLVEGEDKQKHKMGLTYAIAGLMDGDFERLIDCLFLGHKFGPDTEKLTRSDIEKWMDTEDFDPVKECNDLLDFFGKCGFTKKKTEELKEAVDKDKKLKEAQYEAQMAAARAGTN